VIRTAYLFRAIERVNTFTVHNRRFFLSGWEPMVGNTWITDEEAEEYIESGRYKLLPD
jgi:hypothetical protein